MFCDRTNTAFCDLRTSEDKERLASEKVTKGMSIRGTADVLSQNHLCEKEGIAIGSYRCEKVKANGKQCKNDKTNDEVIEQGQGCGLDITGRIRARRQIHIDRRSEVRS
jgi:hypothetical protein